ncbi:hypothetical protein EW146_g4608 [Bondarzewia mesenterica]|uniref:AB hydrolase-1 domain-containing protein n=1 Tax=Bondarzewia mesenterica TaxID=1095465 RepID=A0A4V3XF32_9AGAM|nr:hypothetical protein EW146_g4608 [Bondarzewia mesenterica]
MFVLVWTRVADVGPASSKSNCVMMKHGLCALHDTGPPKGSDNYTTLVVLHGYAWHSAVFIRLLPLSEKYNSRVVLVNRRDYPGAIPFDEEELRRLNSVIPATPDAAANIKMYMKDRARELYGFLEDFVKTEEIPPSAGDTGGLVVAGWSFSTIWMTALLAHVSTFPRNDVELHRYVRRVVAYGTPYLTRFLLVADHLLMVHLSNLFRTDPPYHSLGYPPPAEFYNPLSHASLPRGEGAKLFPAWVSGYYRHGDSPSELEHRTALHEPRPTILTMSQEDVLSALHAAPTDPGGSDAILLEAGIRHGLYASLKEAALYPPTSTSLETVSKNHWPDVEVRYLWCDHSVWEMPWGTWALQAELETSKRSGKRMRNIRLVRLRGANHFAHWDQPERVFRALLENGNADDYHL